MGPIRPNFHDRVRSARHFPMGPQRARRRSTRQERGSLASPLPNDFPDSHPNRPAQPPNAGPAVLASPLPSKVAALVHVMNRVGAVDDFKEDLAERLLFPGGVESLRISFFEGVCDQDDPRAETQGWARGFVTTNRTEAVAGQPSALDVRETYRPFLEKHGWVDYILGRYQRGPLLRWETQFKTDGGKYVHTDQAYLDPLCDVVAFRLRYAMFKTPLIHGPARHMRHYIRESCRDMVKLHKCQTHIAYEITDIGSWDIQGEQAIATELALMLREQWEHWPQLEHFSIIDRTSAADQARRSEFSRMISWKMDALGWAHRNHRRRRRYPWELTHRPMEMFDGDSTRANWATAFHLPVIHKPAEDLVVVERFRDARQTILDEITYQPRIAGQPPTPQLTVDFLNPKIAKMMRQTSLSLIRNTLPLSQANAIEPFTQAERIAMLIWHRLVDSIEDSWRPAVPSGKTISVLALQ